MSDYNIPTPEERRRRREEESGDAMKPTHIMRTIFGIIMVIVYVGMGVLLIINFFNWAVMDSPSLMANTAKVCLAV